VVVLIHRDVGSYGLRRIGAEISTTRRRPLMRIKLSRKCSSNSTDAPPCQAWDAVAFAYKSILFRAVRTRYDGPFFLTS